MKEQEKIEKTFREKLEDYKVPVAASAWAGIESALGNATTTAASSVSTLFYAAAVVVSVIFTSVLVSKTPAEKEKTTNEMVVENNTTNKEPNTEHTHVQITTQEDNTTPTKENKKPAKKHEFVLKEVTNKKAPEEITVKVEKIEVNKLFAKINSDISGGYAPLKVSFDVEASSGVSYKWNFGDKSESYLNNPVHIFSRPGKYTVTFVGTDKKGNSITDSQIIEVKEGSYIGNVSSIITPNNDNRNDEVSLVYKHITEFKMTIYNDSGKEIFETTSPDKMWNGKDKKGRVYPSDTYFYIIKASGVDGKIYNLTGEITLLEKYRN